MRSIYTLDRNFILSPSPSFEDYTSYSPFTDPSADLRYLPVLSSNALTIYEGQDDVLNIEVADPSFLTQTMFTPDNRYVFVRLAPQSINDIILYYDNITRVGINNVRGQIELYDTTNWALVTTFPFGEIIFSPSSDYVVISSNTQTVVYSLTERVLVNQIQATSPSISSDSNSLVLSDSDNAYIYDLRTGQLQQSLIAENALFMPNTNRLILQKSNNITISAADSWESVEVEVNNTSVEKLAFSSLGGHIAVINNQDSDDCKIQVIDLGSLESTNFTIPCDETYTSQFDTDAYGLRFRTSSGNNAVYFSSHDEHIVVSDFVYFIVCKFGLKPLPFRQAVSNLSSGWLGCLV